MRIGKKINLSLEEKFKLFIKNRIANSYSNEEEDLINVFASSELINKELWKKGIDYRGKNINDLFLEIENLRVQIIEDEFRHLNLLELENTDCRAWGSNTKVSGQLNVLKECVLELAFYINDYQYEKMDLIFKREFENIRQFSSLLRKYK
ncbi:hypothetical protein [Flavobacterium sp. 2]|uniref:hypothetical protein n=1 Tax=Flavobacterium sp. 2 TaxID=308053 RepID=UPI000C1A1D48|nr:hypothetical protein [Flavobacterium sp. 2]PIF69464.1 hypothetical protein CLU99_0169 [Flavobacterium sp. 2]